MADDELPLELLDKMIEEGNRQRRRRTCEHNSPFASNVCCGWPATHVMTFREGSPSAWVCDGHAFDTAHWEIEPNTLVETLSRSLGRFDHRGVFKRMRDRVVAWWLYR